MTAIYRLISFFRRLCPNLQFSFGRPLSLQTYRPIVRCTNMQWFDSNGQELFFLVPRWPPRNVHRLCRELKVDLRDKRFDHDEDRLVAGSVVSRRLPLTGGSFFCFDLAFASCFCHLGYRIVRHFRGR